MASSARSQSVSPHKHSWLLTTSAVLPLVVGVLSILQGISAISDSPDGIAAAADDVYVYDVSTTVWGLACLALGIGFIAGAIGVATGVSWGRQSVVVAAALAILANFLSVPYEPTWSILMIALGVTIVWAVVTWPTTTHDPDHPVPTRRGL